VIARARQEGVARVDTFAFASGLKPGRDVDDVRQLSAALAHADVVHVHRGKEHWLAAVANRVGKVRRPLVRTRHIVQAVRPHAGNRWLYRHATDLVVTVSEAIRGQYVAAGLMPEGRVVTIPGGVDTEQFRPRPVDPVVRRGLGANDETLVGMVAGLRVMKGHTTAVDAVSRLDASKTPVHLAFVGQGRSEPYIRRCVTERGLEARITVAGFTPDVPAAMAAFDVALYIPLESEGMSRVVFEYLAMGCAVIAARTGVVPELLKDDEHAVLVPAGDAAALADAIARVATDAPLRARLATNARTLVEDHYSGARVAERLETLYAGLLDR
jgi:glycosyltransferase involved in cell wall biosynthesis